MAGGALIFGGVVGLLNMAARAKANKEACKALQLANENALIESANNRAVFCTNTYIGTANPALPYSTAETLLLTDGSGGQHFQNVTQKASVNLLTSGTSQRLRNKALTYFCYDALANGKAVVIVHCDNQDLQQQLKKGPAGKRYLAVDGHSYKYDPFVNMASRGIASLMFEAIPEKYRAPYSSKLLIQVVAELRRQAGGQISLKQLASSPIHDLIRVMDKHYNNGKLSDTTYNTLRSDYVSAQNDAGTLRAYLDELDRQLSDMFSQKNSKPLDFEKAIKGCYMISINISSQENDLVVAVITEHLRELFRTKRNIALVLDGINIHPDNKLVKLLQKNQSCHFAISSEDAYAALGARKDEVNALLGGDCRLVLFRHGNQSSCEFWSEYFGEYERVEILESFNEGQRNLLSPADMTRGWSPNKTKERKLLPDVFMKLTDRQFCAYDAATGQTILGEI